MILSNYRERFDVETLEVHELHDWNFCNLQPGGRGRYFKWLNCKAITLDFSNTEDGIDFLRNLRRLQMLALEDLEDIRSASAKRVGKVATSGTTRNPAAPSLSTVHQTVDNDAPSTVHVAPSYSGYGTASDSNWRNKGLIKSHHDILSSEYRAGRDRTYPEVDFRSALVKNEQEDDANTAYSNASSILESVVQRYASALAESVCERLQVGPDDANQAAARLALALPRLLKALALTIGHDAPSQMHCHVMYLIHRHRGRALPRPLSHSSYQHS